MVLSAKVLWPLFPFLLLIVVVSLTWALVHAVRRSKGSISIWFQAGALGCYLLAAIAAIASERGAISAHIHRPFSLLTQVIIVAALYHCYRQGDRPLLRLNAVAWSAILADTALHYVLSR
jgi:hypothetical protein